MRFASIGGRILKKTIVCFFVLFVLFSWFVHTYFAAGQIEAEQMLAKAENDLVSAYASVAEADRVGADVSELLVKLGLAEVLLAEADNAYRVGDHEKAYSLAMNCSDAVNNVVYDALALKSEAEEAYSQRLLFSAVVSGLGLSVLFVLSLFGWRLLKKRYLKQVLKMRPEVEGEAE